jgi:preprotein translocase subunit SecG
MLFVQAVLWVLLIVSVVLLIGVILLQEGKGGGLAEAFGGAGAETFGVKAAGINKFTSIVGAIFLLLCVSLTVFKVAPSDKPLVAPHERPDITLPGGGANKMVPPAPPKKPADKPAGGGAAPANKPADGGAAPADKPAGGGAAPADPAKKDGGQK